MNEPTPQQLVADAIRKVTAKVQEEVDGGHRAAMIDAYDLVEVMLSVADELDPE